MKKNKTIVVVLYKQKIEDSRTFQTLKDTPFLRYKKNLSGYEVVFYDNSPDPQQVDINQFPNLNMSYVHDKRNSGIAAAYNYAWDIARKNGSDWLLPLDHDTELTNDYIDTVMNVDIHDEDVVAILSTVYYEGRKISPVFSERLRPLQGEMPVPGIQEKPIMAINSGTLVSVNLLNDINGFNLEFPLDYLDHWLFHEIYTNGKKAMLINSRLEHELSVMDYGRVSLERYKSILNSEIRYYKNYKKELFQPYLKQLQKRIIKQVVLVKNKKIALYTIRQLLKHRKG